MMKDKWQRLTRSELAELARKKGIAGYRTLRKEELIAALIAVHKKSKKSAKPSAEGAAPPSAAKRAATRAGRKSPPPTSARTAAPPTSRSSAASSTSASPPATSPPRSPRTCRTATARIASSVWSAIPTGCTATGRSRATPSSAPRPPSRRPGTAPDPILRLLDISTGDLSNNAESIVRDIDIHGGANNWYIEVHNPPRTYRVDIGYLARNGQFYVLARSNIVATPRAGMSDVIDENWADFDGESARRIWAMSAGFDPSASSLELKQLFEERLRRPIGSPAVTSFGSGALQFGKQRGFWFQLDAELIVYGATEPSAKVTLQGEPIKLRPDGTFTMRFSLPDSRQIIPAVAMSADGIEERTIVLAVERNTKHLEPVINEVNE